jgi:hypothetical protein
MKTTGVAPEALAASTSLLSRSEMDAMSNSSRSQWKAIRPWRTDDELIHEAPAIVGRETPSALAHATSQ